VKTKIHSHYPMTIKFSRCCRMVTKFSHYITVVTKKLVATKRIFSDHTTMATKTFRSPQCLSPPPLPPFFSLLHFPTLMVTKTFSINILSDPLIKQGVCHSLVLPLTLKSILRQKKNYGNSNISLCKNIIFKKSFKRNQNPSKYYNSILNFKFQHKPKYHLSKILI
jgi:hypothetical protein